MGCGDVAEWSKALAWKVSIRQKRIEGSNPSVSAIYIIPERTDRSGAGQRDALALIALSPFLYWPCNGTAENIDRLTKWRGEAGWIVMGPLASAQILSIGPIRIGTIGPPALFLAFRER